MIDPPQKRQGVLHYVQRMANELNRNRIIAGNGISFRRTPSGTVIDCRVKPGVAAAAASGLQPWTVRYHEPPAADGQSEPPDGQWEVYIPAGAASCGSSCYVINEPASAAQGHEDDESGWYAIPFDESGLASGDTTVRLVAHIKERVSMLSGGDYSQTQPFVCVFAEPLPSSGAYNPLTDADAKTHYPGDVWSSVIATATITSETVDNETVITRSVSNVLKAAVVIPATAPTWFRPMWRFSYDPSTPANPLTLESIGLENRMVYVGGVQVTADDEEMDETAARVYLLIDTTGATPAVTIVPLTSSDSSPSSTAALQYVEILGFTDARLTSDLRLNLTNLPYYRGLA